MAEYLFSFLVFIAGIFGMFIFSLFKPNLEIRIKNFSINLEAYFICPFLAAIVLLVFRTIPFTLAMKGLWSFSTLNPIGILVLFFSMVFISKYLDTTGFFQLCAEWALQKSGSSGKKLFFIIYIVVSILTAFTSNDVVILTFTPFIHYFTKSAGIDPIPFLYAEFLPANTWSMLFIISNPTNFVIGTGFGQNFLQYLKFMFLPSVVGGAANCFILYFLFYDKVNITYSQSTPLKNEEEESGGNFRNKFDMYVSLSLLTITIILMACSSIPGFPFEMWEVSGLMCIFLLIYGVFMDLIHYSANEPSRLKLVFARLPYATIPFLLSLFVLVNALTIKGLFNDIGKGIGKVIKDSNIISALAFGVIGTVFSNIFNNIPFSVAVVPIIQSLGTKSTFGAIYGAIVGANLGANLTPLGALAGIMWVSILKEQNIKISYTYFMKVGIITTPICLLFTILTLMIVISQKKAVSPEAFTVLSIIGQLLIMLVLGYIIGKASLINEVTKNQIQTLVAKVTCPILALASALVCPTSKFYEIIIVLGLGFAMYILFIIFAKIITKLFWFSEKEKSLYENMLVFSNNLLLSFPIVQGIFGTESFFFVAMIHFSFNIFFYSYGAMTIGKCKDSEVVEENQEFFLKKITQPELIIFFIALLVYILRLRTDGFIFKTSYTIGSLTTPLSMIMIGYSLSQYSFKEVFGNSSGYVFSAVRLIIIPLISLLCCKVLRVSYFYTTLIIITNGMPVSSSLEVLAEKLGIENKIITKNIILSTVLSIVTLPLIAVIFI